jgi:hypothetical protein
MDYKMDDACSAGAVGLRTFYSDGYFRNVTVLNAVRVCLVWFPFRFILWVG